jgi:outer membrane protein OmpA-like peptidoglycan-associated protein
VAVREASGFDAEGNRKFRFNLFNTMNNKVVDGTIDMVDENGRKLVSYQGNELVQLKRADASGNIILACEVLGYRKLLSKLNYDNPFLTTGITRGNEEEAVVPFGLVRLQKGDIAVMYNVYFFRDAAIIRPESKYEINNLLTMMNENDKYKIRIHGHANGNSAGKIITMGASKNYFSLTDTKDGRGSAKKLSEERAEVIREYLADQGIANERMEIKAWGGKRPLYDKNHSLAQSNVRVEIEILEN